MTTLIQTGWKSLIVFIILQINIVILSENVHFESFKYGENSKIYQEGEDFAGV